MATKNVTLKVKVSQVTTTPSTLAFGEMAYSTLSNTLFIGDATSTPVAVGGSADHTKLAGVGAGATVVSVSGSGAISSTGGANPVISVADATTSAPGTMSASDKTKLDGIAAGAQPGTVTAVSGTGAISSTGGTTPQISISDATTGAAGAMSAADKSKLDGIAAGAQVNVVLSVAGKTGAVSLVVADVSGAAPLASPTFTGTVTVPTPSNSTDAATKGYVDSVALGLDFKESVKVASTANLASLTGVSAVDGLTLTAGDRVLLKNQTTTSENGIYVSSAGNLVRASDANTTALLNKGAFVYVEGGTNLGTAWVASAAGILGTDPVVFTQFGGGATYSASTGMTLTGTAFSVTNYANIVFDGDTLDGGSF
jgi:hypothetical protein